MQDNMSCLREGRCGWNTRWCNIVRRGHVSASCLFYPVHLNVAILADDDGSKVTRHVVPLDTILVLVIQNRQTGLVVKLLEPLYGEPALVPDLFQPSSPQSLEVVRLWFPPLPRAAPERQPTGNVSRRQPGVAVRPEPSVDVYWL